MMIQNGSLKRSSCPQSYMFEIKFLLVGALEKLVLICYFLWRLVITMKIYRIFLRFSKM